MVCRNELELRDSRESKGKKREVIGIKLSWLCNNMWLWEVKNCLFQQMLILSASPFSILLQSLQKWQFECYWNEIKWDHKISKWITVNIGLNGKFCCICNLIDNGLKKCWIVLITDVPTAVTSSWMWNIVVKMCFLSLFTRFCLFLCIKYHKLSRSVEWHQIIFSEESKSCRNILMRSVYPLLCCAMLCCWHVMY